MTGPVVATTGDEAGDRRRRARAARWATVVLLGLAGCGGDDDADASATTEPGTTQPVTTPASSAPATTEAPATSEAAPPTDPPAVVVTHHDTTTTVAAIDRVDWANLTYDAECGATSPLPLTDGVYAPPEHNTDGGTLTVTFIAAEALPTRPDEVLVQLDCLAGGPGAALSAQLYVFMHSPVGGEPTQTLVVDAEPDARHVVNDEGVVVIDDTIHGANDPTCCPSVGRSRQVVWDGDVPTVVEGAAPDAVPGQSTAEASCVGSELQAGWPDPVPVTLLEQALANAGFEPGAIDGVLDQATIDAVVRLIEFNADNPAIHAEPGAPYTNLRAEAADHQTVRRPVFTVLGIACPDVDELAPS